MRRLILPSCLWLVLLISASPQIARAQTNETLPDLPELSLWDYSVNVRVGSGYRDNLLLNAAATESSYLISSALETMVFRLPLDGRQLTLYLSAEDIRYPDGDEVKKEQLVLALAQGRLDLNERLRGGVTAQYLHQNQVFDNSITDTNIEPLQVVGHQATLRPSLRWQLPRFAWLEVEMFGQRQWLEEPVDDYWEAGPRLSLGRDYGHRSTVSLAWQIAGRLYDNRTPLNLDGTAVPGETLAFRRHDFDLAWNHNWDVRRRWRTTTRLGAQFNQDNGPGYFDYWLYRASQQVRHVAETWELKAQARLNYYDYLAQPVSSTDPSIRHKTLFIASLRGEKQLSRRLKLFADLEFEQSLSNLDTDQYRVRTASAGLDWQF